MKKSEIRFTTREGLSLVGDVIGSPDAPMVLLLHGGGQTRHSWAEAMQRLDSAGYFVLAYDSRGHGDSDWAPDGDYSLPAMARDLIDVLAQFEARPALVGASVGGLTSFYAVGHSDRELATALVLVDVVPRPTAKGAEQIGRFMSANPDGFATIDEVAEAIAAYNPHRPRPASNDGLWKNLRRRENGRLYWHWDPKFLSTRPETVTRQMIETSPRVQLPTLLVRGGTSELIDDAGVEEMRQLVPQTEVYVVSGAGHMIAGDRNDAFIEGILPFLARHHAAR